MVPKLLAAKLVALFVLPASLSRAILGKTRDRDLCDCANAVGLRLISTDRTPAAAPGQFTTCRLQLTPHYGWDGVCCSCLRPVALLRTNLHHYNLHAILHSLSQRLFLTKKYLSRPPTALLGH
ncbi:hypothetical protein QBC44DRAFT_314118 [Cladorrhinum sp. PSN332]|nr:hypothetical protein QBC44DRAFT_314118 [Cladorrhinum sp. PSN332]